MSRRGSLGSLPKNGVEVDATGYVGSQELKKERRAVRITADGDEYLSSLLEDIALPEGQLFEPFKPSSKEEQDSNVTSARTGNRRDTTIGTDDRTRITATTTYPYSTIGRLAGIGCTGTVISRTSVLTNAHCVYSLASNTWYSNPGPFQPARSGSSIPYGNWDYEYITIYSNYYNPALIQACGGRSKINGDWDIAVMNIKPLNNRLIGEVVGGTGLVSTYPTNPALQSATITGYPGDKGGKTEMWYSPCPNTYAGISYWQVSNKCEIIGANSGSALMENPYWVHGVLWGGSSVVSVGNLLRDNRYTDIVSWSGRGLQGVVRTRHELSRCMDYKFNTGGVYMYNGCHYGNNQIWYMDKTLKQIKSKHDGKCLHWVTSSGKISMQTCLSTPPGNQKWYYNSPTGEVKTEYPANHCLDYNFNTGDIYMYPCHGGNNQKFVFPDAFW
jgi:V8-like Glu-specific endopeptidase